MSHLIIEQGKNAGKEITVPEDGLKFGRSPVNDIVLKGSKVMLFHGRFFFKSDGTLWVTDFGAAEKTTVGGQPVDEEQLKVGDLVEVGDTAFRVLEVGAVGMAPSSVSATEPKGIQVVPSSSAAFDLGDVHEEKQIAEIDLGFKHTRAIAQPAPDFSRSLPSKTSFGTRIIQVVVILLVLVVVAVVGPSIKKMMENDRTPVQKEEVLTLAYERVFGDSRNIFRYYLELNDAGDFSVKMDDLKHNRHTTETKHISGTVLLQLANGIKEAGFFDSDDGPKGDVPGKYDYVDIAVLYNGLFQHVRQLNRSLPPRLERTVELIEEFAENELGISFTWKLPVDELMKLANDAFMLAEIRYAERNVRYENLATAIKHYEEARLYMETIEPKPALFQQATDGLKRAKEEQSSRYDDFSFRADRAIRLKNWPDAAKHLRIVLELVPDRSDERHEKANIKLLRVEQNLK